MHQVPHGPGEAQTAERSSCAVLGHHSLSSPSPSFLPQKGWATLTRCAQMGFPGPRHCGCCGHCPGCPPASTPWLHRSPTSRCRAVSLPRSLPSPSTLRAVLLTVPDDDLDSLAASPTNEETLRTATTCNPSYVCLKGFYGDCLQRSAGYQELRYFSSFICITHLQNPQNGHMNPILRGSRS